MGILSLISLRLECEFPLQNENSKKSWGSYWAEGLTVIYKHEYNLLTFTWDIFSHFTDGNM